MSGTHAWGNSFHGLNELCDMKYKISLQKKLQFNKFCTQKSALKI